MMAWMKWHLMDYIYFALWLIKTYEDVPDREDRLNLSYICLGNAELQ